MVDAPPRVAVLLGPTASGKTRLALEIAGHLGVEVISVDSAQVYRDMDIGTAKPTRGERAQVPHHLIDIVSPVEPYSAAGFASDARRLIGEIAARGKVPVLVGGTMLYFKALRDGLSTLPSADPPTRALIDAEAAERGWTAMHAELQRVDPATAARLKPGDSQRIQRALEVHRLTGRPLSELIGAREGPSPFRFVAIALVPARRADLHQRIEQRFDAMLKAGLVEELRALRERYALTPSLPAMRSVGYRQAWQYLEGELDQAGLRDRGIFATRQLAKRQLTWLRSMGDVTPLECFDPGLTPKALRHLRDGLET